MTSLSGLAGSPVAAAPPAVGGTGTFSYLEADPAIAIGEAITLANGVAYAGEYLQFAASASTSSQVLTLASDASPVATNGVVSIVGSSVYLGNGSAAENIGAVDSQRNGLNGQPLRINFTNEFQNPGFETADLSSWTAMNQRINLGVDSIAGCTTIETPSYPGQATNRDNNVPSSPGSYSTVVDSAEHSAGSYSLRLLSQGITTAAGYDVVHGPAVYSAPFAASQNDKIYFDWQAKSGDDAEDVFGYIVNTATCAITVVLDHTGASTSGGSTGWATVATTIPASGNYRFVFVSGTFDLSGGRAAGASLYIDNVRVYGTKATDDVAQQVARRIRYANTSLDVPTTRTVTLTARNSTGEQGSGTITVNETPLPEAPVYLDDTLGTFRLNVAFSDAVTTRAWPFASYAVTGTLPTGVTFDPATATFAGTPTVPSEAFNFTVVASNASGSTPRTYTGSVRTAPQTFVDADPGQFLVGQAHSNAVEADGTPSPTYGIVSGNLPAGITLNPTTGALTGTPTTGGPYTFTVRATNIEGSLDRVVTGNVYNSPFFTDGTLATFVTGTAYSDAVAASGLPTPTYTVTSGALPAGLTLHPSTGAVTGTPTAPEAPYSFQITATNVAGTAVRSFSGTVNTIPRTFTDATLAQPYVGQPYLDGIAANGFPTPTYAVTQGSLPSGLSLNTSTGAITGTPSVGGAYSFRVTATNSVGSVSQTFNGNVFGIPSFVDDAIGTFVVDAPFSDGVFALGVPTPTYSVTAGQLPDGIVLHPSTGVLSGTPTDGEAAYSFTITATNITGSDVRTYTGNVESEPDTFSDADVGQFVVGRPHSDAVRANGMQAPTYAITSGRLPAGVVLNAATGALTGTPTTTGAFAFWVTATNSHGSISTRISGTVASALQTTDGTIADFHVGQQYADGVTTTGYPAAVYTVSNGSLPTGVTLDPVTGAVSGTPTDPDATYAFTITATNLAGSVDMTFAGNVHAAPRAVTTVELGRIDLGQSVDVTIEATGFPAPTFSVSSGQLPAGLTLDPITGEISGTPTVGGPYSFTITATNPSGTVDHAFSGGVVFAPVTIDDDLASFHLGQEYGDDVLVGSYPAATYSVTAGALPAGITLDPLTGAVSGTPTDPDAAYGFTLTATNFAGSVDMTFAGNVNAAPSGIADVELDQLVFGEPVQVSFSTGGTPAPNFAITDGALPDGLTLDPATGIVTGTPTAGGPYRFTITATNDEGSSTATFDGVVATAPAFTDSSIDGPISGQPYNDAVTASGVPAPSYAVTDGALPAGLTLDPSTGAITGTPTRPGAYTVTVTATTVAGAASIEVTGMVRSAPSAPTVGDIGMIVVGAPVQVSARSTATPAATYSVTAGTLPAGLRLDPDTGAISGTASASGPYSFTITASNSAGSTSTEFSGVVNSVHGGFVGFTPGRLVDTRDADPLPARDMLEVDVLGRFGVPNDATAVVLNVTVTDPAAGGYVTVFPCGADRPLASNLNFVPGETTSNSVTVSVGAGGRVCVDASARVNVVVDVDGAFSPSAGFGQLDPLVPHRLFDSRDSATPVLGGSITKVRVIGAFGVSDDAEAAVLNVTATAPEGAGFLTVFPCGTDVPLASNVNFVAGETVPNAVTTAIGDDGAICVYSMTTTHLVVDLDGVYHRGAPGHFAGVTPWRLVDTRDGDRPVAGHVQVLDIAGSADMRDDTLAVALNVTIVDPAWAGFTTVYPCAAGRPLASNVNFTIGQTVPNAVVSAVDANGQVCVYSSVAAHLVVDVNGVYTP